MYDITYVILLLTNYPSIKAPKNVNSKDYNKVIKGCKNQAWDLAYLSSVNNLQYNFRDKELFFATNDRNLKLIFMACNFFEKSWIDLIKDRIQSKKDRNEILNFIERKSKNRIRPKINSEILTQLSIKLEELILKIKL